MTVRKISTWGNSLGIRLPQAALEKLGLTDGAIVDVVVDSNKIILSPIKEEYDLEELLHNITPDMQHDEIDLGESVGDEIW
jgi:antitoxin MazE